MIPASFSYLAPSSAEQAAASLSSDPSGSRALGGGTWLVPEMGRGEQAPSLVVDLKNAGLSSIEETASSLWLGATCTYADLLESTAVAAATPLLVGMAAGVTGGRQIQAQGTIGGSACAARPSSDAPAALVCQGGDAVILGAGGERRVPLGEFFSAALRTAVADGELLTGFELTRGEGGWGYSKLKHVSSSWPIVTAAAHVVLAGDGACAAASLVLGAACPVPVRVELGAELAGEDLDDAQLERAGELVAAQVDDFWEDALAPASYRAAVVRPVARRALAAARDDARARSSTA